MPASKVIELTVTLKPDTDAAAVASRLTAAGLEVTDVFDIIGVVQGRAPKAAQGKLAKVAGVADVSPTVGFSVGPPDSGLG